MRMQPRIAGGAAWVSAALAASAAVFFGYHLILALRADDANHLETPLALALARQAEGGPAGLYGPYSGESPLVLVHAPLYYRIAEAGASGLVALGLDPVAAALAAGRALAVAAMLALLLAAARLATLDGLPRRAGAWAALLIAASPVFGGVAVSVRPDTLGALLQTLGVLLALDATRAGGRTGPLLGAYAAFALAVCAKQHDIAAAAVTTSLLVASWARGRTAPGPILKAHLLALGLVVAYYGAEELATGGHMARSVFVLPGEFRRVAPASWGHVATVALEVAKRSVGLFALGLACLWGSWRRALGDRLDAALWLYLAAELALMVPLCLGSEGAWANYAMQAVVFGAILLGRALARVLGGRPAAWRVAPIGVAALVVLAADARLVGISIRAQRDDRAELSAVLGDPAVAGRAARERYFVGLPQYNRRFGNVALAHDEWLYACFEWVGAAEPRQVWLRDALTAGPVRLVVVPHDDRRDVLAVPGVVDRLPWLGYVEIAAHGRYHVWERRAGAPTVADRRPPPG